MRHHRAVRAFALTVLGIVLACGSGFANPSATLEQIRNGQATSPTTPSVSWVSGNAGSSNSHYLESHSDAFRVVMDDLPVNTPIELIVGFDVKASGKYALDYMTHFQRLLPHQGFSHAGPEVIDPLDGVSGVSATLTTAPIPPPTNSVSIDPDDAGPRPAALQPLTSFNGLPAGEREATLYGGTLIDVTYAAEGGMALATSSSETQVRFRFTVDGPKAVIAWGGHIASRTDWGFDSGGAPRSAGGINGSSYHAHLVNWSLGNLGSMDRSLQADAVLPPPTCEITNAGPFCAGSNNLHAAPASMDSYAWSLFDNTSGASIVGSSTGQVVMVNAGNAPGSYGVLLTITKSGLPSTCNMIVTVNPGATADAGPDQSVCSANPAVTLAGSIGGSALSGTWSGGAGSFDPSATALNATYTPTAGEIAAGSVTLTLTTDDPPGPCSAAADQVHITIGLEATATAGPDQTVCAASPKVTLAGSVGGGASSGTWSGGAGSFDPNASTLNALYTPTVAEIAAGTVTLTLTTNDPAGPCSAVSDAMVITIDPAATVAAGDDQTVCATSPDVTLAGSFGGAASAATWSGGAGTFAPNATTLNATYTPSAGEIAAGSVTLTLTSDDPAGPCAAVSDAMRITIAPAATVSAGDDRAVCASSPDVTLAGSIGGAASEGTWSGGAGTFAPNATTLNATYTPSAGEIAAGSVTLTLTTDDPSGPCGAVSDAMLITIAPAATVSAGDDRIVCASSPDVTLAGSVGGATSGGTWSGGAGTFAPNATTLNATYTPSAGEIAAGSVTLTLTIDDPAGPCAAASDPVVITIDPAATADAGPDQAVCVSNPVATLAGVVGGGATSGTWSGGAGTFTPGPTTLDATYTPTADEIAAGSVTLTLTTDDPAGPCLAAHDQVLITITPVASADAGPDQTVCGVEPVAMLAGSVGGGATSGTWSGGAGTFTPDAATLNAIYTPTAAEIAAGSVILTLTTDDPAGPCGPGTDQVTLDVGVPASAQAGPDQTICSGSTVTLAGSIGGTASSGTWSGGTGTFTPDAATLNAVYTPSAADVAAGGVTLTLTTDDPVGACPRALDTIHITIESTPSCTISGVTAISPAGTTTLCGPPGMASYLWNTGATSPCITVGETGSFSLVTQNSCGTSSMCEVKIGEYSCGCPAEYPNASSLPRSLTAFSGNVIRATVPGTGVCSPQSRIKLWYNDEDPLLLGIRQVVVTGPGGTTTTDYPVSANGSVSCTWNPELGTTLDSGDQSGNDEAAGGGRPVWPALFITDLTLNPGGHAGDWQSGGIGIKPDRVCGSWKTAVKHVDNTVVPAVVTIVPDANPALNGWTLGAGADIPPSDFGSYPNEGYGAELSWSLSSLGLIPGHMYRLYFIVHDGDVNRSLANVGQWCATLQMPQVLAAPDPGDGALPKTLALHPNTPNPFSAKTTLRFALPEVSDVSLDVYDLSGRRIATIAKGSMAPGEYTIPWTASDESGRPLRPGFYLCRLQASSARTGDRQQLRKMMLVR